MRVCVSVIKGERVLRMCAYGCTCVREEIIKKIK